MTKREREYVRQRKHTAHILHTHTHTLTNHTGHCQCVHTQTWTTTDMDMHTEKSSAASNTDAHALPTMASAHTIVASPIAKRLADIIRYESPRSKQGKKKRKSKRKKKSPWRSRLRPAKRPWTSLGAPTLRFTLRPYQSSPAIPPVPYPQALETGQDGRPPRARPHCRHRVRMRVSKHVSMRGSRDASCSHGRAGARVGGEHHRSATVARSPLAAQPCSPAPIRTRRRQRWAAVCQRPPLRCWRLRGFGSARCS